MENLHLEYISLIGLALALLVSIYTDLKSRMLYNNVNIIIALMAPLFWYATGTLTFAGVGFHLLFAACIFLFFCIFFALGQMGGGDVKLLTVMALWFDFQGVFALAFYTAIYGAVVTIVFWARHKLTKSKAKLRVPYGVAIALSGFTLIGERFFNQFSG